MSLSYGLSNLLLKLGGARSNDKKERKNRPCDHVNKSVEKTYLVSEDNKF